MATTDFFRCNGATERADKLVCLGRAIGAVEFLLQRDLWRVFPGGMPYIVINDNLNQQ